jgi:hypothetical protein
MMRAQAAPAIATMRRVRAGARRAGDRQAEGTGHA